MKDKAMKKNYTARWAQAGKPSLGSVGFDARSDYEAKQKADKIADEIGLPNTPRTITCDGKLIECLMTGKSKS